MYNAEIARFCRTSRQVTMRRLLILVFLLALALINASCRPDGASPTAPAPAASQQLVVLPDDGVDGLIALIDGARESVRLKIYLLTNDDIITALAAAASRGVDVRVLIEKNPVGGGESNQRASDSLQEAGVSVRWTPSRFQLTHEKSLLVDDSQTLVGTFNYTHSSFENNREYGLLIADPAIVDEVAAIFDADWEDRPYGRVGNPALVVSPLNSRSQIEAMIDAARTTLWLEQSTLLDNAIASRLAAAARRGVDVRFLGPQRTDEEDLAEPNYLRLQSAGVQVARIASPYIHAKIILADGRRALVGSINLTRASIDLNRELAIVTEDAPSLARLKATFESDWQRAQQFASPVSGVTRWQEAGDYIGAEITVEGEIVRTHDTGKVTFLNFTPDYQGTLSLVIFASDYADYPAAPAGYFRGKRVRATGPVKEYQGAPEIVIESSDQIEVLQSSEAGSDAPAPTPPADAETPAVTADPTALASAAISWQQAGDFIGQQVAVEGKVVRTHDTGNVTFLNFTNDWRGTFSVVIFTSDYDKFPQPPSQLFLDQFIRVDGRVKEYQGAPEIVVESPAQIEIITPAPEPAVKATAEGAAETKGETGVAAPTATAVGAAAGLIPWQEAGNYLDQTITVSGRIVRTYDAGSITFLNFSAERDQFVVVIFADDYADFPSPPADLYRDQTVWVTGTVGQYNGVPQIVVSSPDQIEIFP